MTTTLGVGRTGTRELRIAVVAVAGFLAINVLGKAGLNLPPSMWSGYLALAALLGLSAFAAAAPREGLLAAIVLIPVGFPPTVPHTFTTSPSDYLIAGALATLVVRFLRTPKWEPVTLTALAIPILVAGTTAVAFAVNLSQFVTTEQFKLGIAELVGIGLASATPLAIVLGLRTRKDIEQALLAGAAALAITLTFGLIGVLENLACRPATGGGLFSLPSGRASGLIGDPNLFGLQIAVLAGLAVPCLWGIRRGSTRALLIAGASASMVIAFSGSRTALATFVLFAGAWTLYSLWQGRARGPALVCFGLIALSPVIWPALPCPFSSNVETLVTFGERNNDIVYFERIGITMEVAPIQAQLDQAFAEAQDQVDEGTAAPGAATDTVAGTNPDPISDVGTGSDVGAGPDMGTGSDATDGPPAVTLAMADALRAVAGALPLDVARQKLWDETIDIWLGQPVLGYGPGMITEKMPNNWRSHNTYLTTLAETGIVGLLGFLFCFGLVLAVVVRHRGALKDDRTALAFVGLATAVALIGAGGQDLLRQPILWVPPGLLLALVAFRTAKPVTDSGVGRMPDRRQSADT